MPLFGSKAGQWSALGTLGGEMDSDANGISDTGLVVGFAAPADGYVHGFDWNVLSGMSDLGVLSNLGHLYSEAIAINTTGTLIVGWSSMGYDSEGGGWNFSTPNYTAVVWTPSVAWENGKLLTKWKINILD